MRPTPLPRIAATFVAAILVAACSGGASTATTGSGATAAASSAAGGGVGSGSAATPASNGGSIASLNACNLLTAAEIKAAVGWPVSAGVLQNTDTQTDCEWAEQGSDGFGVGVTVAAFDNGIWQTGSASSMSTAVTGIGDAAFKGWPHPGDLSIKVKGYLVNVAVLDLSISTAKEDAETLALAKLVVPRL